MHGLNIIRRLNDEEHQRVTDEAIRRAQQERHQPQLEQTLAEYYANRQQQYAAAGF